MKSKPVNEKILWVINAIMAVVLITGVTIANASGSKAKTQNPLYDSDGNVVGQVFSYDAESCVVTAPDQSGKVLYVICVDDD